MFSPQFQPIRETLKRDLIYARDTWDRDYHNDFTRKMTLADCVEIHWHCHQMEKVDLKIQTLTLSYVETIHNEIKRLDEKNDAQEIEHLIDLICSVSNNRY